MSRSEPRAAFTLLEVMAAVAILGVLYTVLAGIAIEGLRAEGESRRRLEASLLADRRLAEIETALEAGAPPDLGEQLGEEGHYEVRVQVVPFALPTVSIEDDVVTEEATPEPDESAPIRAIHLTVSWLEGFDERRVTRTTWGFDSEALRDQVATLAETAP